MRTRIDRSTPLFTFATFDASDAADHPNVIADIYEGRLDGAIVRGVLSPARVAEVNARLGGPVPLPRNAFPHEAHAPDAAYVLGSAIVGQSSLDDYFEAARRYRTGCQALFEGICDFEAEMASLFAELGAAIAVEIPPGPNGGTYTSSTIRVLPPGREIGVHVGNEFLSLPEARHLASMVDLKDQISWFVTLQAPEAGGELKVYGLEYEDSAAFVPTPTNGGTKLWLEGSSVFDMIDALDSTSFAPGAGDLLLFDGGRWWHRVTKVRGERARRTIGGFCAYSTDHERLYVWS